MRSVLQPKARLVRPCRCFPLTPALSPSDGERETLRPSPVKSLASDYSSAHRCFSLSPSDGERAGVRGENAGERSLAQN